MSVYWIIVAAVVGVGIILPQQGNSRKLYIAAMAVLHAFVCGFRYMYLTGDLRNYAADYYNYINLGWFDAEVFQEGRNTGFLWLMKLISEWTNGDFQTFLIILAIFTEIVVAILIFRYSPKSWLSYLVWNCMGFYVSGFSLIKQSLAMAVIMCAMMCIFDKKPIRFLVLTLIAGFIHMPALAFLPAYFLANRRITVRTLFGYAVGAGIIFLLRNPIVNYVADLYYEEETFTLATTRLGGRFMVIALILLCGFFLKGFQEKNYEKLFNIIIVAAVLQMFSGFDNVFTRLADYYLQFLVLFIPMIFYNAFQNVEINHNAAPPVLPFNERSIRVLVMALTVILIWWYYQTCIGVTIANPTDDYTNFRFMWDVIG